MKNFFFEKKSHNAEKTERGNPLDFSTSVLSEKLKGDPLGIFFEKKVSQRRLYSKAVPFGPFEFLR